MSEKEKHHLIVQIEKISGKAIKIAPTRPDQFVAWVDWQGEVCLATGRNALEAIRELYNRVASKKFIDDLKSMADDRGGKQ